MGEGAEQGASQEALPASAAAQARRFVARKFGRVAMRIVNEPGGIRGTVIPHPKAPKRPPHPFVSGQILDPALDTEIHNILRDSTSFDDFVSKLGNWGYFVEAESPLPARIRR
jgi:hypothetical protein